MDLFLGGCSKTIWQYLEPVARLCRITKTYLQDVQNGCPARPQAKEAPEAYPLGYVEDTSELRTKLAAVFNILKHPDKEVFNATHSESDS